MRDLCHMKWNERSQEFESCDEDDPEAELFEWNKTALEWECIGHNVAPGVRLYTFEFNDE